MIPSAVGNAVRLRWRSASGRGDTGARITQSERDAKRQIAIDNDLQRHLRAVVLEETWTIEEIGLLGQLPDSEVARKIRRTVEAVRLKREELGRPNPTTTHWNAEATSLLGTMPDDEVAERLDRWVGSVTQKRCKLGIPTAFDSRKMNGKR
jgi:hypothetical protein